MHVEVVGEGDDGMDDGGVVAAAAHAGDEGAVDFQAVDRGIGGGKSARIGQREFVHQDDHVQGADFRDGAAGGFGVGHDHALGQLNREMLGVSAGFFEDFLELADEAGLVEMAAEEADVDVDPGQVLGFPILKLEAGLLERPCVDDVGDAGFLGDGDELGVGDQAALWVIPAELGFEADDFLLLRETMGR